MTSQWLNQIGDWNPQVLRELKGRAQPRGVMVAVGLSLLAQLLLLAFFYSLLPLNENTGGYSQYCTSSQGPLCLKDAAGHLLVDWRRWWLGIFRVITWVQPFVLMVAGVYALVMDLGQEERRGTLNFIRLSPRSSHTILIGKLLGVPVLFYLAVLIAMPLHVVATIGAGVPLFFLLSFYLFIVAGCLFIYSAALLLGLLGKLQVALGSQLVTGTVLGISFMVAFFFIPAFLTWNLATVWQPFSEYMVGEVAQPGNLQWFYLPLERNLAIAHLFTLFNSGFSTYWIWQALQRRFHSPSSTILSKRQSYGLVAYLEILMLGFLFQASPNFWGTQDFYFGQVAVVATCNLVGFLVLIAILSTHRQSLLDWASYRHSAARQREQITGERLSPIRSSIILDLIWGERSPSLGAIAISLLIAAALLVPWILTWESAAIRGPALLGLLLTWNLIGICAAIAQLALFMKSSRRTTWAASLVAAFLFLPTILGMILTLSGETVVSSAIWLSTPLMWLSLYHTVSIPLVCLTIALHWLILGLLVLNLTRQLRSAGKS